MGTVKRFLDIELVPKSTWYQNVRSAVSKQAWKELRALYLKLQCQYCGYKGILHLHEIWYFDDVNHVQTLKGFVTVCNMCHHIKHLGLAGLLGQRGDIDYDRVIKHYCRINECTLEDFIADRTEAFKLWEERSACEWTFDLTYLDEVNARRENVRQWMKDHPEEVARLRDKL